MLVESKESKITQNPYYGGDVENNESDSTIAARSNTNTSRENIKVTQNPYYE